MVSSIFVDLGTASLINCSLRTHFWSFLCAFGVMLGWRRCRPKAMHTSLLLFAASLCCSARAAFVPGGACANVNMSHTKASEMLVGVHLHVGNQQCALTRIEFGAIREPRHCSPYAHFVRVAAGIIHRTTIETTAHPRVRAGGASTMRCEPRTNLSHWPPPLSPRPLMLRLHALYHVAYL